MSSFNVGMNNELSASSDPSLMYTTPATSAVNLNSPIESAVNQMPKPAQTPWAACAMPWTNAPTDLPLSTGVVQFNGWSTSNIRPVMHHKRKAMDSGAPNAFSTSVPKRHITDEQMARHLSGMHISSQFTSHQQPAEALVSQQSFSSIDEKYIPSPEYEPLPTSLTSKGHTYSVNRDLQRKLRNAQRITICNEIRRIQSDPLLPESLMHRRIERPCTAMVLWQPPQEKPDIGGKDGNGGAKVNQPSDSDDKRTRCDFDNNRPASSGADGFTFEGVDNKNSNSSAMSMDIMD